MGKRLKKFVILAVCLLGTLFLFGCGQRHGDDGAGGVLREDIGGEWTEAAEAAEAAWGIEDFGMPLGTASSEFSSEEDGSSRLTFEIEGEVTQRQMDGYVQSLWRACEKAAAESNRNSSGYVYASMGEARRRQEPLDYFMWYYYIGKQKYHIGVYSTEMELGRKGGLVVRVERV